MKLEDIGYNDDLKNYCKEQIQENFKVGRIIAEHKERYVVKTEKGEYHSEITGNLRFSAKDRYEFPIVGDWVALSIFEDELAIIHKIFPRKTVLERQAVGKFGEKQLIAANVDVAFIIQAVDRDFNINRLERYLTICYSAKVKPVIILSKIDLIDKEHQEKIKNDVESRIQSIEILLISNVTKKGILQLKSLIMKGFTFSMG